LDKRDETTWATLELTKAGEAKAIEGKLSSSLRALLGVDGSFQIFVPYATYTKGGRTVSVRLIEGYAFVATGLPETKYFGLERSPIVAQVFSSRINGIRVLHTLPNSEVQSMRDRLSKSLNADLEVGSKVRITGGNYRDLNGTVLDLYEKRVAVQIEFRSLTSIAVVPRNLVAFASTVEDPSASVDDPVSVLTDDADAISLDELMEGEDWR
jgi:transcription antitermination factor NusG